MYDPKLDELFEKLRTDKPNWTLMPDRMSAKFRAFDATDPKSSYFIEYISRRHELGFIRIMHVWDNCNWGEWNWRNVYHRTPDEALQLFKDTCISLGINKLNLFFQLSSPGLSEVTNVKGKDWNSY